MARNAFVLILTATLALAGCSLERSSNPASPSESSGTSSQTTTTSYLGTWASTTASGSSSASPTSCSGFQWTVTTQTATTIAGDFTASCGIYAVKGSGSGQTSGSNMTVAVTGTGTAAGIAACPFTLNGNGTISGESLTIPYTGTTCFGPVQGTETLHRATPASVGSCTLVSPAEGATVSSTQPTLTVANAARSGPVGSISYLFQLAADGGFNSILLSATVAEQANQTSYTITKVLANGTMYHWRVQASDGSHIGPWTAGRSFVTPSVKPDPPSYPNTGPGVIAYVSNKYPDRLAAGISLAQRKANMEFLRDRIIETGICGGLDLALNLKRGGPEVSLDYITYNKNGRWIGVDIGFDYDNTSSPLNLYWGEAPDDPYATTKPYSPRPSCQ